MDCRDLYSSTKATFDALGDRIAPGTVIVFDEYIGNDRWAKDEFKAFQEAVLARRVDVRVPRLQHPELPGGGSDHILIRAPSGSYSGFSDATAG